MNRNPPMIVILLVVAVVGVRTFAPRFFDRSIVKGEFFSVKTPYGWKVNKDKGKHEVTFISSETDLLTDMPYAIFSIYSEKQKGALFMEDFFPEVITSMQHENGKILETGEELIDGQKGKWILFRYNKPEIAVMTIYIADEYNRLTKIQFVGMLKKFKEYGKIFDEFKKTIKLKGLI